MKHQEEPLVNFEVGSQSEEIKFLVDTGVGHSSMNKLPTGMSLSNRIC